MSCHLICVYWSGLGANSQCHSFEMSAELQEQRHMIDEQRAQLEEDRRKFTEAAIKLGLEREALQVAALWLR